MALGLGGLTNLKDLATKAVDKYKADNTAAPAVTGAAPLAKTASGIGSGPMVPMPNLSPTPILNPGPGGYTQTGVNTLNQAISPNTPSVLDHLSGADIQTAKPDLGPQVITQQPTTIPKNTDVATAMPTQPITMVTPSATPKNTDVATPTPSQPITMTTPPAPKNIDVATPMPNTAPQPPTPATGTATTTTTPAAPDKAGDLYNSVLDTLSKGINSDKPLAGTAAQISQSREALATYAKNAEARAGADAAKSDSLGQGTANAMGQATRQDVLGQLANSELGNTKLVSDEKQGLINTATQAGQFAKTQAQEQQRIDNQKTQFSDTMATNKDQFKQTLDTNKAQFDKTFGENQATAYRDQLERLGQDNPVLATKLTNYLLNGQTGAVGNFTPEEMQQIKDYTAKKTGQDDQLQAVMTKILAAVPGQIASSTQAQTDADAKAATDKTVTEATQKLNSLTSGSFLSDTDFATLQTNGKIDQRTPATLPIGSGGVKDFATKNPSGVVSLNGKQFKVVRGFEVASLPVTEVKDASGKSYFVDSHGRWYSSQPQTNQKDDNASIQISSPVG